MFCTQCGNRINEGEHFCTKCGTRAPDSAPAASGAVVKPIAAPAPEAMQSNAIHVTDSLNTAVPSHAGKAKVGEFDDAPAASTEPSPSPEQPFRMFGVEMSEPHAAPPEPPEPPPIGAISGDIEPVTRTSSGLGAAFWFGAFVVVVLGTVGFFAWTMLSSRSSGISVRVDPSSVQMKAGGTTTLSATVAGDPDSSVTWSVMEGAGAGFVRSTGVTASGGKVAASADYLAPAKPGTYHVLAVSTKDKRQASSAEIVVSP